MLIEVTGGSTWTGLAVLRVGAVRMLSGPTLLVEATLDYPPPGSGHTRDLGRPFAVLATPVFDGTVMVDISVMHGIQRGVSRKAMSGARATRPRIGWPAFTRPRSARSRRRHCPPCALTWPG